MTRWGAALTCGLILASGFSGAAYAAEPAAPVAATTTTAPATEPPAGQPSSTTPAPVTCAPLTEGHFGTLTAGQIGTATVPAGETGCHTVRLTAGPHFIQFTGFGIAKVASVRDAQGTVVCTAPVGYYWECAVPADGDYTILARNTRSTTAYTYRVAAIAEDPAFCGAPVSTAWNAPPVRVASTGLEVQCVRFAGRAGERVVAYSTPGQTSIRTAGGTPVCGLPLDTTGPCELPGTGTYLALARSLSGQTDSEIQVRSLTPAAGCPALRPGRFGTAPADRLSDIRCRSLKVSTAGDHVVRPVTASGEALPLAVLDAAGNPVSCTTDVAAVCTFATAGTYTMIVEPLNGSISTTSFVTAFVAADRGCETTTTAGLDAPAERGTFRAVGQIDCYEFAPPAGSRVRIVLPPNASGAAAPYPYVSDADGNPVCATLECELTGPGPYRLLLIAPGAETGNYAFVLERGTVSEGCRPWRSTVPAQFGPTRFTNCYTFVPDTTATEMTIALPRVAGSGSVEAEVRYPAGPPCRSFGAAEFTCPVVSGQTTTLVLVTEPAPAAYRVGRTFA